MPPKNSPRRSIRILALIGLIHGLWPGTSSALQIDRQESLIAVVTHKEGLASGLAHEHLVASTDYEVDLSFDPEHPLAASFVLELSVQRLEVDSPGRVERWQPLLLQHGLLAEPKEAISDKDREKISTAMLGPKQLDAAQHPKIRLQTLELRDRITRLASLPELEGFPITIIYEIEIKGRKVRRQAAARWNLDANRVRIEAIAEIRFSDLGIRPYSAMLGAIRNADMLHLVLVLVSDGR